MASLTPLSKILIGLAVVGGMASAVWHLGLKDRMGSGTGRPPQPTTHAPIAPGSSASPGSPTSPAVPSSAVGTPLPPPVASPAADSSVPNMSAAEHAEAGRQLLGNGHFAQARVHLEQAVKGGDGSAACLLGEMTLKGQGGIPASQDRAASLFQLAQSRNMLCFSPAR